MEHTSRLTERQKRFADYFLETGNARQSAIRAGYNAGYAPAVRKQPAAHAYIQERLAEMEQARIASAAEVLAYLTGVMRGEEEKSDAARMKAAELLGKRLGVFDQAEPPQAAPRIVDDLGAR